MDFYIKVDFFKLDFLKLIFKKMGFLQIFDIFYFGFLPAKMENRSAARVLSRPEAREKGLQYFGNLFLELGMRRYTCAVAFGRIAQIRIPFLSYRSDSQIRIG